MIETKYKKFEDLEIWQLAKELYLDLHKIFSRKHFRNYAVQDQILRASLSISNNIAEGHERQSNKELIRFLFISKGSCGEVRSMVNIAQDLEYLDKVSADKYIRQCIRISVKINNLISYLRKSVQPSN